MSVASTRQSNQSARTPLLTVPEVAQIFRVTDRTVRRWANQGRIERVKIGNVARFDPAAVEALISPTHDEGSAGETEPSSKLAGTGRNALPV